MPEGTTKGVCPDCRRVKELMEATEDELRRAAFVRRISVDEYIKTVDKAATMRLKEHNNALGYSCDGSGHPPRSIC
jgi:glutaredoxin